MGLQLPLSVNRLHRSPSAAPQCAHPPPASLDALSAMLRVARRARRCSPSCVRLCYRLSFHVWGEAAEEEGGQEGGREKEAAAAAGVAVLHFVAGASRRAERRRSGWQSGGGGRKEEEGRAGRLEGMWEEGRGAKCG